MNGIAPLLIVQSSGRTSANDEIISLHTVPAALPLESTIADGRGTMPFPPELEAESAAKLSKTGSIQTCLHRFCSANLRRTASFCASQALVGSSSSPSWRVSLFLARKPSAKNERFFEMYDGKNLERVQVIPLGLIARVIPSSVPSISHAWLSTMASVPCAQSRKKQANK